MRKGKRREEETTRERRGEESRRTQANLHKNLGSGDGNTRYDRVSSADAKIRPLALTTVFRMVVGVARYAGERQGP